MNRKPYYNLYSYMELSPFVIVNSFLMHVMVLSFLLTLPIYSKVDEKSQYKVYLTGEETKKTQASADRNMSEKQIEAAKNIETAIIPGKIIADIINKGELQVGPLAENIGKETDRLEKTGIQTRKPVEPHIKPEAVSSGPDQVQEKNVENIESTYADFQQSFKDDAPASEMEFPVHTVTPAQNHIQEDPGQTALSINKEEMLRLLSDINNIIEKDFFELRPVDEKTPKLRTEVGLSLMPSVLAGGASETYNRTEKEETDIEYDKGPEKNKKTISKINKSEEGAEAEEKFVLGLPMDESFFHKDIKIEVLRQQAETHGVYMYLLRNTYLSLRKRHTWGREKKVETTVETKGKNETENEIKTVFSVAKSGEGIYTFVIENRNMEPYNTEVVFALYAGQKRERIRKISSVSVPPLSMLRFMFVLPDTVFWDDEKFFTGSIEDSDSITKFNDEAGFVWKEEKDN